MKKLALCLVLGAAAVGCASVPVPADKLARSAAALKSAEEMNADGEPNAALHLRLAREEMTKGKELLEKNENEKAGFMFDRSEADATAARELARAKASKVEVEKTKEQIQQQKTLLGETNK